MIFFKNFFFSLIQTHPAPSSFELTTFLRKFATLVSAGLPIIQSCEALQHSEKNLNLKLIIYTIKADLQAGKTLSYSLENFQTFFNPYVCQLIQIGEITGNLDQMLLKSVNFLEKKLAFTKKIKQILFYPALILAGAIVLSMCALFFIIPTFKMLFSGVTSLPLLTRFIFNISSFLNHYCMVIVMFFLFLCIGFFYLHKKHHASFFNCIEQLPFLKKMILQFHHLHFCRNLTVLLSAGIALTEGLSLLIKTSNHPKLKEATTYLLNQTNAGSSFNEALIKTNYFPALMIQMVKVGEEAGKLELMLEKAGDFLEDQFETSLQLFAQLLEPLIMATLGVLIGGLVLGMYLPIFQLGSMI